MVLEMSRGIIFRRELSILSSRTRRSLPVTRGLSLRSSSVGIGRIRAIIKGVMLFSRRRLSVMMVNQVLRNRNLNKKIMINLLFTILVNLRVWC